MCDLAGVVRVVVLASDHVDGVEEASPLNEDETDRQEQARSDEENHQGRAPDEAVYFGDGLGDGARHGGDGPGCPARVGAREQRGRHLS